MLSRGRDIVPIPGTTQPWPPAENVAAAELALTKDELARIDAVALEGVAAGERYNDAGMETVNG